MAGTNPGNFTVGGLHVSAPLTNLSIGYHPQGLVAEKVLPVFPVKKENDLYYFWDKGQSFRVDRTDGYGSMRADKARPKRRNYGATTKGYTAQEFALETEVSDREYANADSALQLELSKTRRVQDEILIDQEIRVATIVTTAANNTGTITLSGTAQWNNAGFTSTSSGQQSVIVGEFQAAIKAIIQQTGGLAPNKCVIPYDVAAVMNNDPGIADLLKYTHNDILEAGLLPSRLWGMDVIIPRGQFTSTNEGETYSASDIWGKNVWIGYVNPQPGLDILTYGQIFRAREWQTKIYREEQINSAVIQPSIVQTEKLIAADCGYLMINVIA